MVFLSKNHEVISEGEGRDKKYLLDLRLQDVPALQRGELFWPDASEESLSNKKSVHRILTHASDPEEMCVYKKHGNSWDLDTTWDEYMELLKTGWPEGADKALDLSKEISNADMSKLDNISVKRRRTRGSQGDYLNMEKVYSGRLEEAWTTFARNRVIKSRRISLICGWGGNCGRSSEELFWTGAVALALTNLWERAGYRVNIKALSVARWDDRSLSGIQMQVKEHGQPVNPGFLAAMLCHPAGFRKIAFLGKAQSTTSTVTTLLGYPQAPHSLDITQSRFVDPQSVVLDKVYSKEDAIKSLARNLTFMIDGGMGYQG